MEKVTSFVAKQDLNFARQSDEMMDASRQHMVLTQLQCSRGQTECAVSVALPCLRFEYDVGSNYNVAPLK